MVAGYLNSMTERLSIPKISSNSSPQRQVNKYLKTLTLSDEKATDHRASLHHNSIVVNDVTCNASRIEKLQPTSPAKVRLGPIDVNFKRNMPITAAVTSRSVKKTQDSLF